MLNADVLTFQEFVAHETLPLSRIHESVLQFLQGRDDAVLFGAQAVNAYSNEPRMTQDVDILSNRAEGLADELRAFLSEQFHIAVRVREIKDKGFRIYQVKKEGNRHLADIRQVDELPESESIENINVLSPAELIASKVISFHSRRGKPKSGTDWRDIAILLLKFPELKTENGPVTKILIDRGIGHETLTSWREIVAEDIRLEDEDDDLNF
jgi:hypothetical protein